MYKEVIESLKEENNRLGVSNRSLDMVIDSQESLTGGMSREFGGFLEDPF